MNTEASSPSAWLPKVLKSPIAGLLLIQTFALIYLVSLIVFDGDYTGGVQSTVRRRLQWNPETHVPPHDYTGASVPPQDSTETQVLNHDLFVYHYNPLDPSNIIISERGYSGRQNRSIADVRFNKCPPIIEGGEPNSSIYAPSLDYIKGVHRQIFPLMPSDYPVRLEKAAILQHETMADSVVTVGDFQLHGVTAQTYGELLKEPYYPSSDPNNPFWEELRHVVNVQLARRSNEDASLLNQWPGLWSSYNLTEIAKLVQNEYPASLQQSLMEIMIKEGVQLNRDIVPFRSMVDFVSASVRIAALNTWAIDAVAPVSFLMKWHAGVPRPEEIAWLIYTDEYTADDGVPQDIIDSIKSMNLAHAAEFTAYANGSPFHPSWPAMHAAGSSCSFWLPVVVKLTPEEYCEALRLDYGVAYARTVAGVHYQMDNYAGLNLGTLIIKDQLPTLLSEKYGFDFDVVKSKLEDLAFDWEDFNPYDCTIASVPVGSRLGSSALN